MTTGVANLPDYLAQDNALALAARIKAFWRDRGFQAAEVWAEKTFDHGKVTTFVVRSNMVWGFPPREVRV